MTDTIKLISSILANGRKILIFLEEYFKSPKRFPNQKIGATKYNMIPKKEIETPNKIKYLDITSINYLI